LRARYPGLFSRAAGGRCPQCGAGQSAWALLETARVLRRNRLRQGPRAAFIPCPRCGTALRLGGARLRQTLILGVVIAPITAVAAYGAVYLGRRLGLPIGEVGPIGTGLGLAVAGPVLVGMPILLVVRLFGVIRA